jgi:hypothetical protein
VSTCIAPPTLIVHVRPGARQILFEDGCVPYVARHDGKDGRCSGAKPPVTGKYDLQMEGKTKIADRIAFRAINAVQLAEMTTILILEPDNPCNTTIVDNVSDVIRYRVTTEHTKNKTVTYVKNAAGETIASSEWRDIQSDMITIGKNPPVPSSTWLKKSMIPFKE